MDGDPSPDVSASTKSSKKKKTAPAPTPATPVNVVVEDLGPNEIRIETPVASEDTPPTAPKKKTKHVGFSGIDDDVQGLDQPKRQIRKTVYQPEVVIEDVDAPAFSNMVKSEEKKITERDTEIEKKEPWDLAKVEPDPIELTKIPSPWPHYFRIYVHRFFSLIFLAVSTFAATFQYVSFAVVCYLLNPHTMNNDVKLYCPVNGNNDGNDYAFYGEPIDDNADGGGLSYDQEVLLSRLSHSVFWALLVPDLYCFAYSFYFVMFKKVDMPKVSQFFGLFFLETLYAISRGALVFFVAPYFTKSLNISMSWFITLLPIIINLTSKKETIKMFSRLCPNAFGKMLKFMKKFLVLGIWIAGIAAYCFTPASHSFRFPNRDANANGGSETFVVFGFVGIMVLLSFINAINFSMVSSVDKIKNAANLIRGMDEKYKQQALGGLPQGYDLSVLVCYSVISLWRLAVTVIIYLIYCAVWNFELGQHSACDDRRLDSSWFTLATNTDGSYSDAGLMDFWIWMFVVASVFASYVGKVSVRVDLQRIGFAVPGFLGPICAVLITFIFDVLSYNEYKKIDEPQPDVFSDNTSTIVSESQYWDLSKNKYPIWGFNDYRLGDSQEAVDFANPAKVEDIIIMLIVNGCGLLSFVSLTTHVWTSKAWTYPLERDVFVLPGFRIIYTSLYNLLNRRVVDLEEELQELQKERFGESARKSRVTQSLLGRNTMSSKGAGSKRTTIWDKGQSKPYIFICTTLWHEEEAEMQTLMRSVSKLLRHARRREQQNRADNYNIEMHIFFDNVFEKKKRENREGAEGFQEAQEWLELNEWVIQFLRVMENVLAAYNDNAERCMHEGKIIRTPYGGRLEYKVAGYPFIVHLKNADLVQRGKRWSQVMYLYYLIGWKMDACRLKTADRKLVQKEKAFILALDGDVDFDPPAFELVLDRCLRNDKVAACCGQIHPTGSGYLVAYQNFEYAVGHWLQKTAEHVLGCVLCSPGCFSLMRVSYLNEVNVMAMYKSLARTPMQKLQYDQGEDRWLCTLMLMSGGRIEFEGSSHCNTFAPEDLGTFYKRTGGRTNQRRRWGPSTTANIWELIKNQKIARKNNPYISSPYILYQFTVLVFSMIGLSTTIMMIAEAFGLGVGAALPKWACYMIVLGPVIIFTIACYISGDGELQLMLATWFSLGFSFIMACVLIGIIIEGVNCPLSPSFLFFAALALINIIGALLHGDIYAIICGVIYFLFIPSCFIFLMIYSVSNLNDVSWGTRQGKSANSKAVKKTFWQRLMGKSDDQVKNEKDGTEGTNCTCVICLDSRYEIRIKEEVLEQLKPKKPVTEEPTKQAPPVEEKRQTQVIRKSKFFKEKELAAMRLSTTSSRGGAFLLEAASRKGTINEYFDNTDMIEEQMDMVNNGFMKPFSSDRKTVMADEKGMNEIIIEGHEIVNKQIKSERLYGGFQIRKLRNIPQDDWAMYMVNPRTGAENRQIKPRNMLNDVPLTIRDVRDRELKNYKKCGGTDYLSWIICDRSPFKSKCKVYSLSNPEQEFWETMADHTDGYIGIRIKGRNYEEIKELEQEVAEGLTDFRNEKFMYYIFINVLWMIVSLVLLMYSDLLLQIKIPLPGDNDTYQKCGVSDDELNPEAAVASAFNAFAFTRAETYNRTVPRMETPARDYGSFAYYDGDDDYEDEEETTGRVLIIQPFSIFFLFIYIVIIITQFICMLWHRLSTLWHFIAYIDVEHEQLLAIDKAEERERMIEKTKKDKNQEAMDAENPDSDEDFEDDNYFDVDDADDEFADAVIETEEYASARASARASANMVPAVGLKATDAYSDQRPLIGGSTDTTPMQSFLSIPNQQTDPTNGYKPVRYSKASIKPDEDKISESSDDKPNELIQMSSTSPSDSNEDSPRYASSNFDQSPQEQTVARTVVAPGHPIAPVKSAYAFEVESSSATKDGVTNSGYVDDEQQAVVAIDQASRAHLDSSPGWTRNQIKEETRQKLDQDQNAARERLGLVRRELSMLAASRDTINIDPDNADDFDYLASSRSSVRSNPIQTNQLRAVSPHAPAYDPYERDPYVRIDGHNSSEENV